MEALALILLEEWLDMLTGLFQVQKQLLQITVDIVTLQIKRTNEMRKFATLFVLTTSLLLVSCGVNSSEESTPPEQEKSVIQENNQDTRNVSEKNRYNSINDYIHSTLGQQFSILDFDKKIEKKELITTVKFSVDNDLNKELISTEKDFYWSIQLPFELAEKMSGFPDPVFFESIPSDSLTKSEKEVSNYTNYYQVKQKFDLSEDLISLGEREITRKNSGNALKIMDENYEEEYVFIDL